MGTPAVAFAKDHQRRSGGAYYPLRLVLSYIAYCDGDVVQRGTGETTEISSASVRVKIDDIVSPDAKQIKLSIAWPATLSDGARLQFVVQGEPLYAGPRLAEVAFWKYEFKTAPRRAMSVEAGVANGRMALPTESLSVSSAAAATL
jgi:hypothetical protein